MSRVLPQAEPRYSELIGRPIDNTALVAANCWWKFLASMVLHMRKEGAPPPGIANGSNWHHALEAHYKYVPPPELRPSDGDFSNVLKLHTLRADIIHDLYNRVEDAVMSSWEDHQIPDDHRTFRRLMMDYESYTKRYGLPWEEEAKTWGWPEAPFIEKCGEVAIPGCRHPYAYKIDRVFKKNGLWYIQDHKTSSRVFNFNEYTLDNQMMGYAVCAWLLTGQLISGVEINAIVIHKNDTVFERRVIPFADDRLIAWMRTLDVRFEEIEEHMEKFRFMQATMPGCDSEDLEAAFPRNHTQCAGKYGMCTYAGVCSLSPEMRVQALKDDFSYAPWNPLEVHGEVESV